MPQERAVHRRHPLPQNFRHALRLVGWNALFLVLGLALIGVVGEMYFRLRAPFLKEVDASFAWSPTIGRIYTPNTEARWTNRLDYWTESRTNSLGFVDREPIGLERAAASCHIAMIGDSYVEAREVPIADKFHVRLEELAAEELRHLDITTSAFGIGNTGQVNQLAYYDEFAQAFRPALLVLVFVANDFMNNAPILDGLQRGMDPDRLIEVSATRGADGTITLRPPHPPSAESRLATMASTSPPWHTRVTDRLSAMSPVEKWLTIKTEAWFPADTDPELIAWVELLSRRSPRYAALFDGWRPTTRGGIPTPFLYAQDLPPVHEDGLDFTGFALDQFRERADRDGAALVILTSNYMGTRGDLGFDRLTALAEARGIPVIDYHDYVLRQGAEPRRDTRWKHDAHWNTAGHQWAAEALLEYLKENQEICTRRKIPTSPPPLPSWRMDYESIASGEPVARSDFDVYADENTVSYLKSPCSAADVQAPFFLALYPEDVEDLPADRRQYGFDNLDFRYPGGAALAFGGMCIAKRPLPDYPIARIRTGQFVPVEGGFNNLWEAEMRLDDGVALIVNAKESKESLEAALRSDYETLVSGEPVMRSDFDVYLSEDSLTYAKEPCASADTEARFFLALYPADANALPDRRKQHGFDNLDFDFDERGLIFDGRCMARIPLPEYDITRIETGQYIHVEGGFNNLWEAEMRLDE